MQTYYTLKDKIVDKWNLADAAANVFKNKGSAGIDNQTIEEFRENYKMHMREIHRQLLEDRYKPSPVLRVYIPKGDGRKRPLGIPTVRDRIVQEAVRRVIEPIFEEEFCECSYGFREGCSALDAIEKIEEHKKNGYKWVVDADIKGYFDNINQSLLMDFVANRISDGWVLRILKSWLTAGVMTENGLEETKTGTPQGGVISPLLANIFLHQFDKEMVKRGYKLVRYADDFVVLTKSKRKSKRALEVIKEIIEDNLRLTLHPDKTELTNFGKGFIFLGYEFIAWKYKRPRKKSIKKFKDKIRNSTKRQNPRPVELIIKNLNPVIRGWSNYFKEENVKTLFRKLDKWIRMRLRSFIEGKKAIYNQNKRISNSYFRELGLVSLLTSLS